MIYTLTLNPAVDRELTVPAMEFDSVLRASESRVDFGGKGFNVSRLLKGMESLSTAVGFLGGRAGELLQDGLQSLGIGTDFVWVSEETRTNVSIVTQSHDHYIFGCAEKPYLVKPNAEEARALTGLSMETPSEIATAAAEIRRIGVQNVVVSMGKAGALLHTSQGTWLTHSPKIQEKNPIGAGDSMVGGLVWALTRGIPLKEALGWGVASGAATASLPGTEVGSRPLIEELYSQVRYERLETV